MKLLSLTLVLTLVAAAIPGPASSRPVPADLVLLGGRIVTLEESLPEVGALAAKDGRIVWLGDSERARDHIGRDTEVIDLDGALAVPGFIEGHGHFLGIGDARMQLDLMGTESWEAIVAMVEEAVRRAVPGELIRGRGWHQEKWTDAPSPSFGGLPVHDALSAVSPDNPVILRHASGHASFANAKAMELAGIDRNTAPPEGGEIVRDPEGGPIGMFRETAQRLLTRVAASAAPPDPRRLAELANREVVENGITSFQDAGSTFEDVALFKALVDEGALDVRLWVMLRDSNERLTARMPQAKLVGYGESRLTVAAIKHSIDGALGPHGAWLLAPYSDEPSSTGLNTTPVPTIELSADIALEHGLQLCVHAIGDRANRETLDLFARKLEGVPNSSELRWRVEHAQHLALSDIPRFADLGVIASMQGVHCTSDAPWVIPRLGEQRAEEGAYVWQKLLKSGAVVTNGTDAPVEDVSPIESFYATVSRRLRDGSRFFPDQRMSRLEALRSYTISCAYAAFEEHEKGSLALGKLADVTVLSKDILGCPEEEIPEARVLYTVIGGEIVYAGR